MLGDHINREITNKRLIVLDHSCSPKEVSVVPHVPLMNNFAPRRIAVHILYLNSGNLLNVVMAAVAVDGLDCFRITRLNNAYKMRK